MATFLFLSLALFAQQPPATQPPEGVRITFLPPPLEGTLSAGVYTAEGKLIRILAREATERDFTVGLNGFITHWDGKGADGGKLAAGKYFVRGYAVADIEVQGVEFHGNDWLSEADGVPRLADILAMQVNGPELLLAGRGLAETDCIIHLPGEAGEMKFEPFERRALSSGNANIPFSSPAARALALRSLATEEGRRQTSAPGTAGTQWAIEKAGPASSDADTVRIVQRAGNGSEVRRELEILPDEPQPIAITASPERDEIYLLERDAKQIRVRGLRLKKTENDADGKAVSEWELFVTKTIRICPQFAGFVQQLKRTPPPQPVEKLRVTLVPNDLLSVAPAAIQIGLGFDGKGSFLQTVDGLPLRRLTDTPNLRWTTLASASDGSILLFQSDGAAVEEYRLGKLNQMMAFEAGEYDLPASR